jgi:adenosine kinase
MAENGIKRKRVVPAVPEGVMLGMGNPLLDIAAVVKADFVEKYGLTMNTACLAEEKHMPMFEEIVKDYEVTYVAGGSTQNTMRVAQWMLGEQPSTVMIGCVGTDANAAILRKAAEKNGVKVAYVEDTTTPTGVCAALVTDKHRTLCANIAAANNFREHHLEKPENWALVERAHYIYIEGYFMTVSPASIQLVAKHCADTNKVFALNLAAPFISQFFFEPLSAAVPYCDYLFGNETEALAFAGSSKWETTNIKEIAEKIAALPKANSKRERTVVITQGHDATIVVHEGKTHEYPVHLIEADQIVDTNGAGDAFVGGFYSQLILGQPLHKCVHAGHYSARVIIQHVGCTFPEVPEYEFDVEADCKEVADSTPVDQ